MLVLRVFAIFVFLVIAVYTALVVTHYGPFFLPTFVSDILSVSWSGQFNLDFMGYLLTSALWVAWRHGFSVAGIVLALIASVGGMLFFAPYLLYATVNGSDLRTVVLGVNR